MSPTALMNGAFTSIHLSLSLYYASIQSLRTSIALAEVYHSG